MYAIFRCKCDDSVTGGDGGSNFPYFECDVIYGWPLLQGEARDVQYNETLDHNNITSKLVK